MKVACTVKARYKPRDREGQDENSKIISGVIPHNPNFDDEGYGYEAFYQLGTIFVPGGSSSLKVTLDPSANDIDGYPDLVLISPDNEWYDYDRFSYDDNGNFYSGYESDPEIMEIFNPLSGAWKVGVYRHYEDIGEVSYTLEANFEIIASAGEIIERPNGFPEVSDVIIPFTEDEEWRLSITQILYDFGNGNTGVIPSQAWDNKTSGQIVIYGAPRFEFIITVVADGYEDKVFTVNEGISPLLINNQK